MWQVCDEEGGGKYTTELFLSRWTDFNNMRKHTILKSTELHIQNFTEIDPAVEKNFSDKQSQKIDHRKSTVLKSSEAMNWKIHTYEVIEFSRILVSAGASGTRNTKYHQDRPSHLGGVMWQKNPGNNFIEKDKDCIRLVLSIMNIMKSCN